MNGTPDIDLLIIGQGLAGSALALRALSRGYKILVIDNPSQNHSSRMAAGLFNPVTGPKLVKTWQADNLFPCLMDFYRQAEKTTKRRFLYEMPIYRPFIDIQQQNEWMGRSAEEAYLPFLDKVSVDSIDPAVNAPFGGITLKQTGYLDTRTYLDAARQHFEDRGAFREQLVKLDEMEVSPGQVRLGGVAARMVVFCQGVHNLDNPWFRNVPINSLKGEFLTVQCGWKKNVILNRNVYLVPAPREEEWRVGATYNWNDRSQETTTWGRNELTRKLAMFFRFPYSVTGQSWGVRPTTPDRKPILGSHPEHPHLVIFNGLGTKGVSLAPYFSEVLIRWVENKGTIHKEADVSRFY